MKVSFDALFVEQILPLPFLQRFQLEFILIRLFLFVLPPIAFLSH